MGGLSMHLLPLKMSCSPFTRLLNQSQMESCHLRTTLSLCADALTANRPCT